MAARDGRGAQDRHAVTEIHARDAAPHFHDGAGALVAENDRRIVPEGVVQDVEIGPAHPAERDLDLHLVRSAHRLVNVQDVDVAGPGSVLDHCFHQNPVHDDGAFLQGLRSHVRVGKHELPNLAIELVARGDELSQCAARRRKGVEFFA